MSRQANGTANALWGWARRRSVLVAGAVLIALASNAPSASASLTEEVVKSVGSTVESVEAIPQTTPVPSPIPPPPPPVAAPPSPQSSRTPRRRLLTLRAKRLLPPGSPGSPGTRSARSRALAGKRRSGRLLKSVAKAAAIHSPMAPLRFRVRPFTGLPVQCLALRPRSPLRKGLLCIGGSLTCGLRSRWAAAIEAGQRGHWRPCCAR